MDSLAYPIFTLISAYIRLRYNQAMDDAGVRMVDSIGLIALLVETLYVTNYGFMIAFQKSTEAVPEPNVKELIYHGALVALVIGLLKSGNNEAVKPMLALRNMIIEGLTGSALPGGEQVAKNLGYMDLAFSIPNIVNSVVTPANAPDTQSTMVTLALIADVSPQITGGIMLLINELIVRTGMALFPIALYGILYKITRNIFATWFQMVFAASIQMGVLAILVGLAAQVVAMFQGVFVTLALTGLFMPKNAIIGTYVLSELQQSAIQAGLGTFLTAMIVWVPGNVASYAAMLLNSGTTKPNLGAATTPQAVTPRNMATSGLLRK